MNLRNDFNSWKDMIKSIEEERKKLPWDKSKFDPVIRVDSHERIMKERQLNPVTMQYIDPDKESLYQTKKENLLKDKTLKATTLRQQKLNIITNEGPPRKIDKMNLPDKSYKVREYDLISNLKFDDLKKATTIPNESIFLLARPNTVNYPIRGTTREFNLISNIYKENHEEKIMNQYSKTKEHVLNKYWQTHNINPILGKYYDLIKDETSSNETTMKMDRKSSDKEVRLPPSIKLSEGKSYNIINNDVKNLDYLKKVSIHEIRRNNRINRTKDTDLQVQQRQQELTNKSLSQSLNRISFERFKTEIERGYNIVSTVDTIHNPFPQRPATVWGKVTSSVDISTNNLRPSTSMIQQVSYRPTTSSDQLPKIENKTNEISGLLSKSTSVRTGGFQ